MTKTADMARPGSADTRVSGGQISIASADLFQGETEVVIVHKGASYRLRITRQDKLILTK